MISPYSRKNKKTRIKKACLDLLGFGMQREGDSPGGWGLLWGVKYLWCEGWWVLPGLQGGIEPSGGWYFDVGWCINCHRRANNKRDKKKNDQQ